jgi:hypothetical protein
VQRGQESAGVSRAAQPVAEPEPFISGDLQPGPGGAVGQPVQGGIGRVAGQSAQRNGQPGYEDAVSGAQRPVR